MTVFENIQKSALSCFSFFKNTNTASSPSDKPCCYIRSDIFRASSWFILLKQCAKINLLSCFLNRDSKTIAAVIVTEF